jgi:hypothetical protein
MFWEPKASNILRAQGAALVTRKSQEIDLLCNCRGRWIAEGQHLVLNDRGSVSRTEQLDDKKVDGSDLPAIKLQVLNGLQPFKKGLV